VVLRFQSPEVEERWFVAISWAFFRNHAFLVLRYKKPYAALAMEKTKPISNPTTRFTSSWDKQIPPTRRKTIKQERLAVPPRPYGMGQTAHQPPTYVKGEESIGKNSQEESHIKMYRSKETLRQAP